MNEAVCAAWDKVTEDWQSQPRHDALVQLAVQHSELKWVASKYRERKGDAIADGQLAKLTSTAMAMLVASAPARREAPSPYKRAVIWLLVFLLLAVVGLIAVKLMASVHHPRRP